MKLGFVGTGAITSAIVAGLRCGGGERYDIRLSPRNAETAAELARRFAGVSVATSNQEVLDESEIVVLAVRPQVAPEVISELRFRPDHHVISLVAGLPLRRVAGLVAPAVKFARAVPLPAVAERRGTTGICPTDEMAADLFGSLGAAFAVEAEGEFDAFCAATAMMASYFAFADSIASWMVRHGVAADKARGYIGQIFWAMSSTAVDAPELSFQALARDHATPGGLNEQMRRHLEEHRMWETVSDGLDAVLRRTTSAPQKS